MRGHVGPWDDSSASFEFTTEQHEDSVAVLWHSFPDASSRYAVVLGVNRHQWYFFLNAQRMGQLPRQLRDRDRAA
jgi:hypothetical protein